MPQLPPGGRTTTKKAAKQGDLASILTKMRQHPCLATNQLASHIDDDHNVKKEQHQRQQQCKDMDANNLAAGNSAMSVTFRPT
jgi:hypothetical protein